MIFRRYRARDLGAQHRALADKYLAIAQGQQGFRAFFDGCCEPVNPGGTAGYGAVIFAGEHRVFETSGIVPAAPTTSNNVAEYLAVLAIFDWLIRHAPTGARSWLFGDSRLVVCQLWGWPPGGKLWKIGGVDDRDRPRGRYADRAVEARDKLKLLPGCRGFWIPREKNSLADDLSKAELRRAGVEFRIQPEEDHGEGEDAE
jgi:ribonuclease HI